MQAAWLEVVQRAQLLRVGVVVPALFMVCERQPAGNGECFGVRRPSHPPADFQHLNLQLLGFVEPA